jgi:hypothetical protein
MVNQNLLVMKKLIYLLPVVIFFTSCAKVTYTTISRDKVVKMMHDYQDLEKDPNPPYLPKTIQTFKLDSKVNKLLAKKCDTVRYIVGALDAMGKQVLIIQLKKQDGTAIFFDIKSIKYKSKSIKADEDEVCPEPPDCSSEM